MLYEFNERTLYPWYIQETICSCPEFRLAGNGIEGQVSRSDLAIGFPVGQGMP